MNQNIMSRPLPYTPHTLVDLDTRPLEEVDFWWVPGNKDSRPDYGWFVGLDWFYGLWQCAHCGKDCNNWSCSKCKKVQYCNALCQRNHWEDKHKKDCCTGQKCSVPPALVAEDCD
jgi:hypothetical protein